MPKEGDVHVVPTDRGWRVDVDGSSRARPTHDKQPDAWGAAREIARKNKSEPLLHGRDGQIRQRSTYGEDPRRTKG